MFARHRLSLLARTITAPSTRSMSAQISAPHLSASRLFDVRGRVAVVSGGATGIGLYATQTLLENGAKVYILGRRQEVLDTTVKKYSPKEGQLTAIQCDLSSRDDIVKAYDQIAAKESCVHLLFNNAGISGPTTAYEEAGEDVEKFKAQCFEKDSFKAWEDIYRTNVISYYWTTIAFLPLLTAATKQNKGFSAAVINNGSISGILNSSQHHMHYNVSKAGVIQLTELLAKDVGTRAKLRINCLSPGIFPSEMTTSESNEDNRSAIPDPSFGKDKDIPAGRPGNESDIGQTILYMATCQYLQGQTIAVDGGYLQTHP